MTCPPPPEPEPGPCGCDARRQGAVYTLHFDPPQQARLPTHRCHKWAITPPAGQRQGRAPRRPPGPARGRAGREDYPGPARVRRNVLAAGLSRARRPQPGTAAQGPRRDASVLDLQGWSQAVPAPRQPEADAELEAGTSGWAPRRSAMTPSSAGRFVSAARVRGHGAALDRAFAAGRASETRPPGIATRTPPSTRHLRLIPRRAGGSRSRGHA